MGDHPLTIEPRLVVAICAALGVCLTAVGFVRWQHRREMRDRLRALTKEWSALPESPTASTLRARALASRFGARLARRMPGEVDSLSTRVDRAGIGGQMSSVELLGWKIVCTAAGLLVGLAATLHYGPPGLLMLVLGVAIGWFGIDVMLARFQAQRRRSIMRDLPTVMDLLVLSLEAGMGLDRAMRTVIRDYTSALSEELRRVLSDVDLGTSRAQAFERMALRVGIDDLRALSRAIVQAEELGVSLVGVMQSQAREVRMARRRAAEAEALRTPIKMLIPLVVFILPTLFMLLVGPVALRAGEALSGTGLNQVP